MRTKLLVGTSWLVLVTIIGCQSGEGSEPAPDPVVEVIQAYEPSGHPILAVTEDEKILAERQRLELLVNEYRMSRGLPAMVIDLDAQALALGQAKHMIECGFFDHLNREGDLPEARAVLAGIGYLTIGENLASGQTTPEEVMQDWFNSPRHHANLLNPLFTHMGAGFFKGSWVLSLLQPPALE